MAERHMLRGVVSVPLALVVASVVCAISAASASAQPGQPGYLTYRLMRLDTRNPICVGVDVASGNLMVTEKDLRPAPADSEMEVARTYNSQAVEPST